LRKELNVAYQSLKGALAGLEVDLYHVRKVGLDEELLGPEGMKVADCSVEDVEKELLSDGVDDIGIWDSEVGA
jgi:hypothetical protein